MENQAKARHTAAVRFRQLLLGPGGRRGHQHPKQNRLQRLGEASLPPHTHFSASLLPVEILTG